MGSGTGSRAGGEQSEAQGLCRVKGLGVPGGVGWAQVTLQYPRVLQRYPWYPTLNGTLGTQGYSNGTLAGNQMCE
jgi:hypothetical protein